MPYTPTNWQAGDVITPVRLNKMEQGIAGAGASTVLHATSTYDNETGELSSLTISDATASEIWAACAGGSTPALLYSDSFEGYSVVATLTSAAQNTGDGSYYFEFFCNSNVLGFIADGDSSNPAYEAGGIK